MKNLIKHTLGNRFNLDNFITFANNFFNEIEIKPQELIVSKGFEDHIKKFAFLGEFSDTEKKNIDILAVELAADTKVERARSLQRNIVAKYLKDNTKDAGLVAFYSKDNPDWRLSFVKVDYKFTERGVKVEVGTPPKRYSFLVGETEPSHTAQKQLLPILEDQKHDPLVSQIEDAFSVEKVTKEFYISILRCFTKLVSGEVKIGFHIEKYPGILKLPSITDHRKKQEFAARLLGRIIFCWFLKKKKSLQGKSLISDELLSRQYLNKYSNYYHTVLEPLFFQQLNTPISQRLDKYANSDIPFLNGGLFQPHTDDFYRVSKLTDLSMNINTLLIPDKWFKELFEILDIYNFTIDESTSIDVDLSIDPEILGRIFENLLAEINPETGETARKSTGSYYTPRPIVEYMAEEALKYYLKDKTGIDLKKVSSLLSCDTNIPNLNKNEEILIIDVLDKLKIIDPACGSGAFPMGILQKVVLILQKVDSNCKMWLEKQISRIDDTYLHQVLEEKLKNENLNYIRKLGIVQNTVYGADIQPMAVEIAKLRFFLSLIVDVDVDDKKENKGIHPLPNLEFKFVCTNSLIQLDEPVQSGSSSDNYFSEFEKLTKNYFSVSNPEGKQNLRKEIEGLINARLKSHFSKIMNLTKSYITNGLFNKRLKQKHEKEVRDISYEAGLWESYLNIFKDEPVGFFNLKYFFPEVKDGFDIVIANPPYVDSEMMTRLDINLRKIYVSLFESAKGNWDLFIIFIEKGLQLLKESGVITYIVPNKLIAAKYSEALRNILLTKNIKELRDYSRVGVFQDADVYPIVFVIQNNKLKNDVDMTIMKSVDEISEHKKILGDIFYQDIYWDRYFTSKEILDIIIKMSKFPSLDFYFDDISSAATVSEAYEIKEMIRDIQVVGDDNFKKLINTGTIDRYLNLWGKQRTQYIKDSYLTPIIYDDDLKKMSINRYNQAKSKKIILAGMSKELECFYDEGEFVAGKSTTIILENNRDKMGLKVILAILNSKLVSFWFKNYFKSLAMAGGYLSISHALISKIPIPEVLSEQGEYLTCIVDKILILTKKDNYLKDEKKQAEVEEYERQIDQMVYKLYDLTEEEIRVVENPVNG